MQDKLTTLKARLAEIDDVDNAAWNAKVKDYLGLDVPSDKLGVLQDTHWAAGLIGCFPTYTIGNLASVQLYEKAVADTPSLPADLAAGRYDTLLGWLRENVHQHGRKYLPADLLSAHTVAGGPRTFKLPQTAEVVCDLFEKEVVARDAAEFQVELPPASTHLYFTGPARLLPAGE